MNSGGSHVQNIVQLSYTGKRQLLVVLCRFYLFLPSTGIKDWGRFLNLPADTIYLTVQHVRRAVGKRCEGLFPGCNNRVVVFQDNAFPTPLFECLTLYVPRVTSFALLAVAARWR